MALRCMKKYTFQYLWIHATFLTFTLPLLASFDLLSILDTTQILQWPAYTILLGDRILRNSSLKLQEYDALVSVNRISELKTKIGYRNSTSYTVASIKELTTRGETFVASRKLHFVFFGEPNEFILLISKVQSHQSFFKSQIFNTYSQRDVKPLIFMNGKDLLAILCGVSFLAAEPFHHSWYIVMSDTDSNVSSSLPQWLKLLQDLNLGVDSDVYLALWKEDSVQVLEVYRICSQCPTAVSTICLISGQNTRVGERCNWDKYERRKNLESLNIEVVAVDVLPFMTNVHLDTNGVARVTGGLFGALFTIIAEELNIKYTLHILNGYQYGAFKNNSWNGMIGYLSRNSADMSVSEISMAPDRLASIDYTTSFDAVGRKIYIRKVLQSKNINWKFYSAPFSLLLHISVVFWIALMMVLLWMAELHKERTTNSEEFTLAETFWISFSSICQKGAHIIPSTRSSRMMFIVFSFTFVIIFCAYSATLISQLSVTPPITVPFRDLKDFVSKAKNWKGGPIKGDLMQIYMEKTCPELLKNQKNGRNLECELLVQLWTKVIQPDKETLPLGFKEGLQRVLSENFAFIATSFGVRFRIINDLSEKEACSVLEMEGDYISSNLGFGLRKNNPHKNLINYKLLQLRKSGVLKRLQKLWLPQRKQCLDQQEAFNDATIYDVGILPLIWLFGFVISFFMLSLELLMCRKM